MKLGAVLLAAGQGSRFQAAANSVDDKLLALCTGRDGVVRPVLEHVLRQLQTVAESIVLVTRPAQTQVIELGRRYACHVLCIESAGMGDSLAAGIAHAQSADGWWVALGDMPFVLPSSLAAIGAECGTDKICAPSYLGRQGHPVLFGSEFKAELMKLNGPQGAKSLLRRSSVVSVAVDDPGVVWDVDEPSRLIFSARKSDL